LASVGINKADCKRAQLEINTVAEKKKRSNGNGKKVTRYTYDDIKEPRSPETGHTSLLPTDELMVTLPMDNGWSQAIEVGKIPKEDNLRVVVDMDPAVNPVLFWSGKRNRRDIPVLPLQRTEVITESRIAQIIERATRSASPGNAIPQGHLFADFEKTLREKDRSHRVEFYSHEEGWKNKLICGDSLLVLESLIHYEKLRGRVQMMYIDPPYGIDFNSNFQQRIDSPRNQDEEYVDDVITIKAFRDTWMLGPHSYLQYLAERLYLSREVLTDSGSIFFQISEENIHLVRTLLDEVFGKKNFVAQILFRKTGGLPAATLNSIGDYLLWYAKDRTELSYRQLYKEKKPGEEGATQYRYRILDDGSLEELDLRELALMSPTEVVTHGDTTSQGNPIYEFNFKNGKYKGAFKPPPERLQILADLGRLCVIGKSLRYVRRLSDFPFFEINQLWADTGVSGFTRPKVYPVQTSDLVVERCMQMTTKPGDLVLDPTLGSGTTALVAERLGRRWIGIDSSRIAINTSRMELLREVFPAYRLKGERVSDDFVYETTQRITMSTLIDNKEPEQVTLFDRPTKAPDVLRVAGPFEVLSVGRYSVEDWKAVVNESGVLSNYIEVICRLYRSHAAMQSHSNGFVHAIAESAKERIAISVGPIGGRVTGKQIIDAVQDTLSCGLLTIHVLGWAFESNVGEIKAQLEERGRVQLQLVVIRPDTLAEGLKITRPEFLFSPLALPDIAVALDSSKQSSEVVVSLRGIAMFDRNTRSTEYKSAESGYIAAWYLDEDYDGDCFVDCQMFFDFKRTPNLKAALKATIDPAEFKLQTISQPFVMRGYSRIAVKVVDIFGNESTVVKSLA